MAADVVYTLAASSETTELMTAKACNATATVYTRAFEIAGADLVGLAKTVTASAGSPDIHLTWQVSHDGETWVDDVLAESFTDAGNSYQSLDVFPSWAYYARLKAVGQAGNGTISLTIAITVTRKL